MSDLNSVEWSKFSLTLPRAEVRLPSPQTASARGFCSAKCSKHWFLLSVRPFSKYTCQLACFSAWPERWQNCLDYLIRLLWATHFLWCQNTYINLWAVFLCLSSQHLFAVIRPLINFFLIVKSEGVSDQTSLLDLMVQSHPLNRLFCPPVLLFTHSSFFYEFTHISRTSVP